MSDVDASITGAVTLSIGLTWSEDYANKVHEAVCAADKEIRELRVKLAAMSAS